MKKQRVVVIGAGMGGLACALRLAKAGREVVVIEAAPSPGGKMRQVQVNNQMLDAGPTVFTMRWVFDELFAECGHSLNDHVTLEPAKTLARHAWAKGSGGEMSKLDLFASVKESADAIGLFAGAADARGYLAFSQRSREIYRALENPFVRGSRPTPLSLAYRAGLSGLPRLARISPFSTLWRELGKHFRDPRLRQVFGRYATYCGSSPFMAPATLMLIAHVEQDGLWLVKGGMHRVATALAQLIVASGATIHYNTRALEIVQSGGRVTGVRMETADGERSTMTADVVVFNGDVAALGAGLLGSALAHASPRTEKNRRSLSALTWNAVTRTSGFPLLRHTVFFSDNYEKEFSSIFSNTHLPQHPSVYICAQDRCDHSGATPLTPERLLCLVNAPATGDSLPWQRDAYVPCEAQVETLLKNCGLQLESPLREALVTTPRDFDRYFPGTGGALYGQASHSWLTSFKRSGSRTRLQGLYLAGGSVHPGPGVPMAALSGRLAAASVQEDQR